MKAIYPTLGIYFFAIIDVLEVYQVTKKMESNRPLNSREYKLILKPEKFKNLDKKIEEFQQFLKPIVETCFRNKSKIKLVKEGLRRTSYLDNKNAELRDKNKTIVRVRERLAGKKPKITLTLKARAADRYLAASRPWFHNEQDLKFEEDITPAYVRNNDLKKLIKQNNFKFDEDNPSTFASKFSLSKKVDITKKPGIKKLSDLHKYIPSAATLKLEKKALEAVNGFKAYEVYKKFEDEDLDMNFCMSFWFEDKKCQGKPLVAEFSFDIEAKSPHCKLEQFNLDTIECANAFFRKLQKHTEWFLFDDVTTKTAFAYNYKK